MQIDLEDLFGGLGSEDLINIIAVAKEFLKEYPPQTEQESIKVGFLAKSLLDIAHQYYEE